MTRERQVACHDCDGLIRLPALAEGATARCPRCGGVLRQRRRHGLQRTTALALAAAVLFVVANVLPFLSFDMQGRETETTLASGVRSLFDGGYAELALLVLLTTIVAPGVQILLLLWLLLPLQWNRVPWRLPGAFLLLRRVQPWSMMEVFLIGILVAIVKLSGMAHVVPGLALWSFVLLMLVLAGAVASFDPHELPRYLDRPELVSRDGAHALALSDTARWGGSLRSEILRVVADDLGALLGTARVAVYPAEPRFAADWRVLLDVRELGGAPGQPVRLRAGWTLVPGAQGRPPIVDETTAEEPVASASAEDYVAAQSAALGRMSREIAERIAASSVR